MNGKIVKTVTNSNITPGTHQFQWNAQNQSSGVYFIQVTDGFISQVQKVILIK